MIEQTGNGVKCPIEEIPTTVTMTVYDEGRALTEYPRIAPQIQTPQTQ
jgi:hypothetical protein